MDRHSQQFSIKDKSLFKKKLFRWAQHEKPMVFLDSNEHQAYGKYEVLLALGEESALKLPHCNALESLEDYARSLKDWIFGYLTYDIKGDTAPCSGITESRLAFFQPKKLILITGDTALFLYKTEYKQQIFKDFLEIEGRDMSAQTHTSKTPSIRAVLSKPEYLEKIRTVKNYIARGDIYLLNFCQEFYAENVELSPSLIYENVNSRTKAPFAAFVHIGDICAVSLSPERFLKREGSHLISQPIKGTVKRGDTPFEDEALIAFLENDVKERAENIMTVDMVRNDLSRFAQKDSVCVDELCRVYTFNNLHQLMSTVSCKIEDKASLADILESTFPMASMTGVPKISAMHIIDRLEQTKRGLYSGSIGYIDPHGNFDFSVVIRTLVYNTKTKYMSFSAGSAITSSSDPEKEYEECRLKIEMFMCLFY